MDLIFPERESNMCEMEEPGEPYKLSLEDKLGFTSLESGGVLSHVGRFFKKDEAGFIIQAGKNLSGFKVEDLGSELKDGTRDYSPNYRGIAIKREDGEKDLSEFWTEVDRLRAEARARKSSELK